MMSKVTCALKKDLRTYYRLVGRLGGYLVSSPLDLALLFFSAYAYYR